MKQRLQKLVVLGLAVATVAGSSVPAYAAEIVPETKAEATQEATEVGLTFPSNWNGEEDVVVKVDVDLTGATEVHFHGGFVDGLGDYGFHSKGSFINAKEGTVKITADTYRKAIQEQNELLKEDGMEPLGEMAKYSCSYVNILYADGSEKNCEVKGGEAIFNAKNPFFEGETNPDGNEDAQAPTVQSSATWNGSGDVVLQFNPNGLTEGSYFGCDAGIYFGDAETGYNADEPEVVVDYEAGTITVPEASLKAMIKSVEAWLEEAGNPQKFESGTGELIFYFDVNGDGEFNYADGDIDTLTNIKMSVKDAGTTDPEQKPDGGEQKPDGGDTQKPDGGDTQKPDGGDTQKPGEDGDGNVTVDPKPDTDNNDDDANKPSTDDKDDAGKTDNKDDNQSTDNNDRPKTGDPSAVAGLLGTSVGSLGVALMALKRRFKK